MIERIIFLEHCDDANIALGMSPDAAIDYLKDWHQPGEHELANDPAAGTDDDTYERDGYILSWNDRLGYIGLEYIAE